MSIETGGPLLLAILAAGASRRLGQPKQLVTFQGEAMLRRQCRMAIDADIGSVAVVLGCRAGDCVATVADLTILIHVNQHWEEGLASSIRTATRAADEVRARGLLLMHADQYRLSIPDLHSLHAAWVKSPSDVYVSAYGDHIGPPVIFPKKYFSQLLQLSGDVGARKILASIPDSEMRTIAMPNASHDLDEPAQLMALLD